MKGWKMLSPLDRLRKRTNVITQLDSFCELTEVCISSRRLELQESLKRSGSYSNTHTSPARVKQHT